MSRYPEHEGLNLPEVDDEVLAKWQAENTFKQSVDQRDGQPQFTFYEGPPSANGMPGIHHVISRSLKDLFCRYKTLRGYQVRRKGGWDTHGLPVELQVEKKLGITKADIGTKLTVAEYNAACREDVLRYKDVWDELTQKMGYWVDLNDPYITFETDYMESVWHLLKRLHAKDLLYKGYTIQPYSPAAGTGLSSHELNMPGAYKTIKDVSAVAQFRLKGADDTYFLAWTTTPWTLPSNTALAVGKNIVYVKVRTFNRYTGDPTTVILAKDRLDAYFSEQNKDLTPDALKPGNQSIPYLEIVGEMKGSELAGTEYEQLLPYVQPKKPAFRVVVGDFVSTEDGTGIVHIAPTFGADDMRVAQQNDIPALLVYDEEDNPAPLVDRRGRFVDEVTDFAGRYVKDYGQKEDRPVDADIAIKLKEEGKLFVSEKYEHSYPHCWRTDRPVLYYPLDSWFIRTTDYKDRFIELNKTINWKPESTGTGRFGNWLENLVDWNLSRSRYWGVPLPIWRTEDGKQEKCIGSVADLKQEAKKAVKAGVLDAAVFDKFFEDVDLHKPGVDELVLVSDDGRPMRREPDLIDVWFDSGAMPFAQWHYPFENEETFGQNFPADFIAEGVDQTRGWFFTLHALAVMLEDSVAYTNVIANGLVLDKNGDKMSKRIGNVVDPFDTLAKHGADAVRWYMLLNSSPWENLRFDLDGIVEVRRKFFGTLYNTYQFFATYANIDDFAYADPIPVRERRELDQWILSVLNHLVETVSNYLDDYDPTPAVRAMDYFVNEQLSNWYIRRSRRIFWKGELNDEKQAAYQTLYEVLSTVAVLMSPVAPFYADRLYHDLGHAQSVHLADWPQVDGELLQPELEERVDLAQRLVSMILSIRKQERIKVRQPLQKALVAVLGQDMHTQLELVADQIKEEVNVKEIQYVTGESEVLVKKVKPNFRSLGPKLGRQIKQVAPALAGMGQDDIRRLESEGQMLLSLDGNDVVLGLEDVEIVSEDIPGWRVATDGRYTVALDLSLTEELRQEGVAREWVNRIQNLRKASDFDVTDRIRVRISSNDAWDDALRAHEDYVRREVLADEIELVTKLAEGETVEVEGVEGRVWVAR